MSAALRPQGFAHPQRSSFRVKVRILASTRRRWCLAAAVCLAVALLAAVANDKGVSLFPPSLHTHGLQIAGATAQASVDAPRGTVIQAGPTGDQLQTLTIRTLLLGKVMSTQPVLTRIADRMAIPPSELSASTTFVQNIPLDMLAPTLELRATQIVASRAPYQLNIQPDPNIPRLEIYAQAPTLPQAVDLADAAVPGLRDYLQADAVAQGANPSNQLRAEQLGPARGGILNSHAKYEIVGLTFLIVFALCAGMIAFAGRVRRGWKHAAERYRSGQPIHGPVPAAPFLRRSGGGTSMLRVGSYVLASDGPAGGAAVLPRSRLPQIAMPRVNVRGLVTARRVAADVADDWPHTTRVLPWMIAVFLFIIWLVPFDAIQIGASLPVDLKFDRIVLPIIVLVWIVALAAGGRAAPRLRVTWIHAGVFFFAALTVFSFVINAHFLNQNLLLDQGVKRLALFISYITFFVMIASIVRPTEVAAFVRYSLVLAVIAAVGTIVQYRFHYNVFYDLAQHVFIGFHVQAAPGGVDNLGRSIVTGPAELPLEAVGMFTMALPIALVGITDATGWKGRMLYGLAAALLLAAALTTERKSGLLGPLAAILTLAFFKRRQLVRLAPLGLALILVVKVVAPGAIGAVTGQLAPGQLGVTTVDDRVIRYDAIRPDMWLHLAFGQGYGTYVVRVLDSELLDRLLEGGVLGLSAYVLMLLSIVFVAIGVARRREPGLSTIAVAAAAAAVSVLVMSALYDLTGYPHDPYILFSLAGLLAVASTYESKRERPRATSPPSSADECVLEEAWSS
jgi:hypothetical protein